MRGGFGETDGAIVDEALADCARTWTRDEVLAAFPETVGTAGDRFSYSNPGYKLVGYVAEAVTGVSLAEAIRTYVVEPVGVERLDAPGAGGRDARPVGASRSRRTPARSLSPSTGPAGRCRASRTRPCLSPGPRWPATR